MALARELEEEVGVTLTGEPELHGIFSNFASFPGDHIAVFVVRHWQRRGDYHKLGEIAEARMFAWEDLPERIDPGTRARLAEILRAGADQAAVVSAQASFLVILATWWPWKLARLSSFCEGMREPSGAAMVPAP